MYETTQINIAHEQQAWRKILLPGSDSISKQVSG
jgi:hypothetical protein